MTPPKRAILQAAYDVPHGNPLKRYLPTDFRLHGVNALDVNIRGGRIEPRPPDSDPPGNVLYLDIDDPQNFVVNVRGFDPNRDVYVRVERVEETTPDEVEVG